MNTESFPRPHPCHDKQKDSGILKKKGAISGIPRTPSLGQQSQIKKS